MYVGMCVCKCTCMYILECVCMYMCLCMHVSVCRHHGFVHFCAYASVYTSEYASVHASVYVCVEVCSHFIEFPRLRQHVEACGAIQHHQNLLESKTHPHHHRYTHVYCKVLHTRSFIQSPLIHPQCFRLALLNSFIP